MNDQEINRIRQQFQANQWPKFLEMIRLDGLRGFGGQMIEFKFPVSVVAGENGTGKSTILKAAACAYENEATGEPFYPSIFFVQTHWDPIENVTLAYRIRQGSETFSYQLRKHKKRWSYPDKRYKRHVYIQDIARTLPLDATVGYAKIAKQAAGVRAINNIDAEFTKRLSHILSRNYTMARFVQPDIDQQKEVGLLTREIGEISQFHQGAGEDATLDLFRILQDMPPYALLIIDEVEASLHPKAQRRLVEFLLWFSRRKRAQIILSTHSPYILEALPSEARILLLTGARALNVVYGVSPEFAMSRLDEKPHAELHIFVEDREAEIWLREIIATHPDGANILARVQIMSVGPANVVLMLGQLADADKLPYRGLGIVDGDTSIGPGTIKFPGNEAPEVVVYEGLKAKNWENLTERFGIGAGMLFDDLEDAMRTPDHHVWNTKIGDRVIKSATSVWEILTNQWCKSCLERADQERMIDKISEALHNGFS